MKIAYDILIISFYTIDAIVLGMSNKQQVELCVVFGWISRIDKKIKRNYTDIKYIARLIQIREN